MCGNKFVAPGEHRQHHIFAPRDVVAIGIAYGRLLGHLIKLNLIQPRAGDLQQAKLGRRGHGVILQRDHNVRIRHMGGEHIRRRIFFQARDVCGRG